MTGLASVLVRDVRNLRRRNGSGCGSLCWVSGVRNSHGNGDVASLHSVGGVLFGIENEEPSGIAAEIWEPSRCNPPHPIDMTIGRLGMNDLTDSQILASQKSSSNESFPAEQSSLRFMIPIVDFVIGPEPHVSDR